MTSERNTEPQASWEAPITRRRFFRNAGAAAAATTVWGSLAKTALASHGRETVDSWTYQMASGWNHEYLGEYAAMTKGWYAQVGLNVSLVTGSPATTAQEYIASGHGDISLGGGTVGQAQAIAAGLQTRIVAAEYNVNPRAIISKASNPISKPTDLYGKTIGVPAGAQADWQQFLGKNNLDASKIHVVPASFDVGPIVAGTWDGMQGLATNQPAALEAAGIQPHVLLYSNYGIVSQANTLIVAVDTLTNTAKRADLKKYLYATILGWRYALKNQQSILQGVVNQYGKTAGLTMDAETLIAKAQAPFILTPWTRKHGLFTISPAQVRGNLATVRASGYKLGARDLFDVSILNEIYQQHPKLKVF